ncbi:M16 family metallopeptidase [Alkalinema pantanalense CENA528]|uniref:M16 family metallopeptidase n=1 Tax=Alkalinema pantanalense TaxID=1620705 RepID=UPI003D6FE071
MSQFQPEFERRTKQRIAKVVTLGFCFIVVPLILVLLAMRPAVADGPKHYTDLQFGPLPEVRVPDYQRFTLKNGLVVYLMEDHELPLVSGSLLVRTGDREEPSSQVGLADITASVLRSGGTQVHPPDQLNQILEQKAAAIEAGIAVNSGSVTFSALSEDLPQVFNLFAEVVQQPAFPQDKIDLTKFQLRGGIARRNDQPGGIASREFRKLIYGSESPYARTVEYATLDRIGQPDIKQFYSRYFTPDRMILGIVGDFNPAMMRQQIEKSFGNWKPSPATSQSTTIAVAQQKQGEVYFANQSSISQSYIQMGHLGGIVKDPDYPALSVMNEVLNGFGGRMFNEVRSRQGLAYSVYAAWSPQFDYPGLLIAGGETKSASTVPFIKATIAEIERIRKAPITSEELQRAKDSVLNSFIFNFQDPAQTLSRLLRYEYFGYPKDYIFQYRQGVEATTIQDVQRVAQTHLQPDRLVTMVVGNQTEINPPLTDLKQPVKTVDITIPAPAKPAIPKV